MPKNWPSIENYSDELIKLMDNDDKYKVHLSQMAFVTGTIADTKFKYVGSGKKFSEVSRFFHCFFYISLHLVSNIKG